MVQAMHGGSLGVGYGLKYQARCLSDVKADTDHTSFIAGTLIIFLRIGSNQVEFYQVHLIRLSSGGTELVCEGLFSHPNEIWDLASCPFDQRIFSTVFSTGESYGAAICQIPELYGQLSSPQLERIASLDAHVGKINCILWWTSGRHDKLISVDEENVVLWGLDCSKKSAQVTAEDESGIYIWDLRTLKAPVQELLGHTHWTWAVRSNPEYDGMILSAGSDSTVNLWLASSFSSSTELMSESRVESRTRKMDPLLNSYNGYEDSVYGLAWSLREPWIFASLSYDGRVVVESVKPFLSIK
ncbi:WD repeat-containing protein DWA2-like isoform X2 [Tripterygium wilfordii]|uniref:WD repeat-containing protein DWA2-like isoform X2 n=1 Tax=Tripterygium wilfordii TaxID=458696 RepID=A0A7J7D3L1_TRIWF|nr:WD repeat-containing protein DWA2-like isoform X2 [Tripterygium wilfordii]